MASFHGFTPFKNMVDGEILPPGKTIVVTIMYKPYGTDKEIATAEEYAVLGKSIRGKHVVYEIRRGNFPSNARNVLKGKDWLVKEEA